MRKLYPQIGTDAATKTDWLAGIVDTDPEVMLQELNKISDALRSARQEILKYKSTRSYVENWNGGDPIPSDFLPSIRGENDSLNGQDVRDVLGAFYEAVATAGS